MLQDILRSAGVKYKTRSNHNIFIGKNKDIEVYIEDLYNVLVLSIPQSQRKFQHIYILDLEKYDSPSSKELIGDLSKLIGCIEDGDSDGESYDVETILGSLEGINIVKPTLVSSIDYNTNELMHRFITEIEAGIKDEYWRYVLHINLTRKVIKVCNINDVAENNEHPEVMYSIYQPFNIFYEKEFLNLHNELTEFRDVLEGWIIPSNKVYHFKVGDVIRTNYPCIRVLYKSNKVETPFIDLKLMIGCVGKDVEGAAYRCIYKILGGSRGEFPYIMTSSKAGNINDFQLTGENVCEEGIIRFINDIEHERRLDKFNEPIDKITAEIESIYSYKARQRIGHVGYPSVVKYFEVDLTSDTVKAVIEYYINISYPSNIDFRIRYTITDDLSISCSILDEFGRDQVGLENIDVVEMCRLYLTTQYNRLSEKHRERLGN